MGELLWDYGRVRENRWPLSGRDQRSPVCACSQGLTSVPSSYHGQPSLLPLILIIFMISSTNSVLISLGSIKEWDRQGCPNSRHLFLVAWGQEVFLESAWLTVVRALLQVATFLQSFLTWFFLSQAFLLLLPFPLLFTDTRAVGLTLSALQPLPPKW